MRTLLVATAFLSLTLPEIAVAQIPGAAPLPQDLSPWSMFVAADPVVKIVMVGLVLASVATWTVLLAKGLELQQERRALRAAQAELEGALSIGEATQRLHADRSVVALLVKAAAAEQHLSAEAPADGVKERVALKLNRIESAAGRRLARGTGILATIGSTGPFIGLFGTVWGIMNSFIGIGRAQTTSLAVVAPGIAEALLATAIGLVAAIPAVVIYNAFARSISSIRAELGDASAEVLRLLSRDLDTGRTIRRLRAAE